MEWFETGQCSITKTFTASSLTLHLFNCYLTNINQLSCAKHLIIQCILHGYADYSDFKKILNYFYTGLLYPVAICFFISS